MDQPNGLGTPPTIAEEPLVSDMIDVTVKTIDSKNFQFQVENDIQIKAFKEKIAAQVDIEPENQRMIFCGRVLSDSKSLKDYNIDNGKVIHVVKKALPPQQRNNNNSTGNANTQQSDQNRSHHFQSYRSDDGHIVMGTISLDSPSNLLNQMVRQLFSGNARNTSIGGSNTNADGGNSNNQSGNEGSGDNSVRDRLTTARRILGYIDTNFQILQNPNIVPRSEPANVSTNSVVTLEEYHNLFNDVFRVYDRLRPQMERYFNQLRDNAPTTAEQRSETQSTHSVLMRISHHLSHVMHLLTDLNVDYAAPNMPLMLNTLDSGNAPVSSSGGTSTTTVTSSSSASTTTGGTAPVQARIEISTSTTPTTSLPRFSTHSFLPSPMVIMEVDTNINLPRNIMNGLRGFNFSFPGDTTSASSGNTNTTHQPNESNQTNNNESGTTSTEGGSTDNTTTSTATANTSSVATTTAQNTSATDTSCTSSTSTSFSSTLTSSASSTATNTTSSTFTNTNSGSSTTNNARPVNTGSNLPFSMLSIFDHYLLCNSTYTLPEVRSAGVNVVHQVMNPFPDFGNDDSNSTDEPLSQQPHNIMNPLLSSLTELFQNLDNSNDSQSNDEYEFYDLLRFIFQQANSANHEDLLSELNGSAPRIGDYLRSLNLYTLTDNQSISSEFLSVLLQNLDFNELLNIMNSDFREFRRFRQPLQDLIRNQLLHSDDTTIENIRNEISNFVSANQNSIITILANIAPKPGVNSLQSFQNFIKETFANFFHIVMQSNSDDSFEADLLTALRYLASSYIHFCRACFADPDRAINQFITNYFEQYANYLNPRIRSFMTNTIIDRINSYSASLDNDQTMIDQVEQYIVSIDSASQSSAMQVDQSEPDSQSVSNDSEVEFADAISDFPSTSSIQQSGLHSTPKEAAAAASTQTSNGQQHWQAIVPSDWVPIISEDIKKQKNIDQSHQPPFSDAYLNGMPKKRRLEQKPDGDESADPKLGSKPQLD